MCRTCVSRAVDYVEASARSSDQQLTLNASRPRFFGNVRTDFSFLPVLCPVKEKPLKYSAV